MTTQLSTLAAELEAAQQDLALWQRLSTAEERAEALAARYEKAKAAHDKQEAAEAEATREARFNGLADIRVSDTTDRSAQAGDHLLRRSYRITYTAPQYDIYAQRSVPKEQVVNGFAALPGNVLAFLIEKHPEQIPAAIAALAPDDPYGAFEIYFRDMRRGYSTRGASA